MRLVLVVSLLLASALGAQAPAAAVATIPVRLESHVLLDVVVNGTPATLILDTGAGDIVIDPTLATRAGLRMQRPFRDDRDGMGTSDSVRIGSLLLRDEPIVVKSFAALNDPASGRPPVLGVVGTSFLRRWVVRLDFAAGTMTLLDPASFTYDGPGVAVPVELVEQKPRARATIERGDGSSATANLFIDLGSTSLAIGLTPGFARRAGIPAGDSGVVEILGGRTLYGQGMDKVLRLPRATLGALPIVAPLVQVSTAIGAAIEPKKLGDGVIGLALLSRTVMFLDYARGRIIFEPTARFHEPVPFPNVSGLQLGRREGKLVVRHVIAGSPAALAGVVAGDELVAIDDVPLPPDARTPLPALAEAGAARRLTLRRAGTTLTVALTLRRLL